MDIVCVLAKLMVNAEAMAFRRVIRSGVGYKRIYGKLVRYTWLFILWKTAS